MVMDGATRSLLLVSALAVFLVGVNGKARVCYSGPPPEPDPDNPGDWMKQVMQEIRMRCPGKRAECLEPQPLGIEDRSIPDDHMRASSDSGGGWPAWHGRLNGHSAWAPNGGEDYSWIEVDLTTSTLVAGVITQGYTDIYLTLKYKVSYQKQPPCPYQHVADGNGDVKVFTGNSDGTTPVTNIFDEIVVATVVRIEPTEKIGVAYALRLELLGCRN